ncbi:MAG: hypothetical protein E4H13_02125 [Calditrichales bacterium]|nr:MAG: hypothetical protein E4H13_02125 [Calditrichales bacterium]
MRIRLITSLFLTFIVIATGLAQNDLLVDMSGFNSREIRVAGFTLAADQTVSVETAVLSPRRDRDRYHLSYTWILNTDTREMVWELADTEVDDRTRDIATYTAEVELPAGHYETYYSTYPQWIYEDGGIFHWRGDGFFSGFFDTVFDSDKDDYFYHKDLYDNLFLKVKGTGESLSEEAVAEAGKSIKENAFLSFTPMRDEDYYEQVFRVDSPMDLDIYAVGEGRRDGVYDFGWIINLKTRERVWEFTYRASDNAGGAFKNRVIRKTINVEPGIYKAVFITDDSHSYHRWNSAPPFDPSFWGLTIWAKDAAAKTALKKLDTEDELKSYPVVDIGKVRSHEYVTQGFSLRNPLALHIYALGEGDDGEMYDYGWIVNAKTREKVWELNFRETKPAGGSSKNRMLDQVISFEAGNYIVHYVTDDSHAYRDWNADPPIDQTHWGITIQVIDERFKEGDVQPYEPEKDPAVLAQLIRVGDDEYEHTDFTMAADGYVHIYALGEGNYGEMHDYAWIKNNENGKVVWEMTYRKTDRAGGAKKNRLFDDKVFLDAGQYTVYYETDGSHAFNDWNDRPPKDPLNWGITISKVDD